MELGVKAKLVALAQAIGLLWRKMITIISGSEDVQFSLWNGYGWSPKTYYSGFLARKISKWDTCVPDRNGCKYVVTIHKQSLHSHVLYLLLESAETGKLVPFEWEDERWTTFEQRSLFLHFSSLLFLLH